MTDLDTDWYPTKTAAILWRLLASRIRCPIAFLTVTVLLVIVPAAVSGSSAIADESPAVPLAEFTGTGGGGFGAAMSADGTTAVVGQLGDGGFAETPGIVHVLTFDGTTLTQQAELTASDPNYDPLFGNAVAVSASGNTVIVGDPGECGYGLENCEHGAAYVFVRNGSGWTPQAELHGGPGFGGAVALSSAGNTALVGAGLSGFYGFFHSPGGNAPPTVFGRRGRTTWTREATLGVSEAGPFDTLGYSVALSADGHTALIGDPTQDEDAGAAYVFAGSGSKWTQQAELTGGDEAPQWTFGASVALSADGHIALVGAPASSAGFAYVFARGCSTWSQQSELTPDDAEVKSFDGWFGDSVALNRDGNLALVGAPWADESLGAAYAYAGEGPSWGQQAKFSLADATPYDYFGDAVALDGSGSLALVNRLEPGTDIYGVSGPPPRAQPPGADQCSGGGHEPTAPGETPPRPGGGLKGVPPQVGRETVSPAVFRAAPHGPRVFGAGKQYGTDVLYTLNEASEVRFTIVRAERGRTPAAMLSGSFVRSGSAGANRFHFTGRLDGHRLASGSYRLIATPTVGAEAGGSKVARFRITN